MKRKYLRFSNKVLAAAIAGLVGGLNSCNYLVKYGAPEPEYGVPDPQPEDTLMVLYGPAPWDTVECEYGVPVIEQDIPQTPSTETDE
ncbi:MAG: hypothetical protein IIU10_03295 [Paludibacteraceae bacterium]|nr:hypothetical protein [Paludibacteraceae bacterium]